LNKKRLKNDNKLDSLGLIFPPIVFYESGGVKVLIYMLKILTNDLKKMVVYSSKLLFIFFLFSYCKISGFTSRNTTGGYVLEEGIATKT